MKKICITLIAFITVSVACFSQQLRMSDGAKKVATTIAFIENFYVDEVDDNKMADDAIVSILQTLDPHSSYISAKEVAEMNEPLVGNFDGIGISFNMMADTLYVIETISGGPSEKVGIMPGDRIVQVGDTVIAGAKMSTKKIMSFLRGPKGTKVSVKVQRRGIPELIDFNITRDKIPIYSLDAAYMIAPQMGYIRLSRFSASTAEEFKEACEKLQSAGMKDLILDLSGNGGGYLGAAIALANEFLDKKQLIVYTEGNKQPKQVADSDGKGMFKTGKLVVLINESSASASEIVSGALQDWDRGVIVGRRSFGKGLVQRPLPLPDGSEIRLTVARYYTPTGRCIQKPYENGKQDEYAMDVIERYNKGEMMSADSIHFPDSLQYTTLVTGRTVYGGGGIMPDYFVPIDTTMYTAYRSRLIWHGAFYKTALAEVDQNRKDLLKKYPTIEDFVDKYTVPQRLLDKLIENGKAEKVEFNEEEYNKSKSLISEDLKSLVARDLYDNAAYYKVFNKTYEIFKEGLRIISDDKLYNSLLNKKSVGKN